MVEHDEKNYDETKPPIPNYLFGLRNQALIIFWVEKPGFVKEF